MAVRDRVVTVLSLKGPVECLSADTGVAVAGGVGLGSGGASSLQKTPLLVEFIFCE